MIRPLVKQTSSRICDSTSQPACLTAGVMNLVQMSRSLSDFLSNPGMYENTSQLKAMAEQDTLFL